MVLNPQNPTASQLRLFIHHQVHKRYAGFAPKIVELFRFSVRQTETPNH